MLFFRLLMLLLWPVRLPFMLLRPLFRGAAAANRGAEAALAGGVSKVSSKDERDYQRSSALWRVFRREPNDETVIRPDQQEIAQEWADKALKYYALQLELFPRGDFYEEAERDHFIAEVARIETGGEDEDQFIRQLREARKIANANARRLYCELAPIILILLLVWHAAVLMYDPFGWVAAGGAALPIPAPLQPYAAGVELGGAALAGALILLAFIYRFSYTHLQRQNAQELNSFIQTEFTSLNQSFNVARAECMQAETRFGRAEHDKVEPNARAWALAYHWIGVRQLTEELTVRNNMFQIRRNTWLYRAVGGLFCLVLGAAAALGACWIAGRLGGDAASVAAQLGALTLLFVLAAYPLIMRRPFEIIRNCLPKDEWSRLYKLRIGEAIAEQVGRDKKQIVIQRDRSAG